MDTYSELIGKIFRFGAYPQRGKSKEPIEWLVLDAGDTDILVISRLILDASEWDMDADSREISWNHSAVRSWLNTEFLQAAFPEAERRILDWGQPRPGNTGEDRGVFLLSTEEVARYETILCNDTWRGWTSRASEKLMAPVWWLRSDGADSWDAAYVAYQNGRLVVDSDSKRFMKGIRPVLRLDINAMEALLPGFLPLALWLSWDLTEFAFPYLTGKAKDLYTMGDDAKKAFFTALQNAPKETRDLFQVPAYEALIQMAGHGDTEAMRALLELFPGICMDCYYDGITPLGAAVQNQQTEAVAFLLASGMDPDGCCVGFGDGSIDFALDCEANDAIVSMLARNGAPVSYDSLYSLVACEQREPLAAELLESVRSGGYLCISDFLEEALRNLLEARQTDDEALVCQLERFVKFLASQDIN